MKPDTKFYLDDEADDEFFSWPQGTKEDPGTSCYELGLIHPHFNDGESSSRLLIILYGGSLDC